MYSLILAWYCSWLINCRATVGFFIWVSRTNYGKRAKGIACKKLLFDLRHLAVALKEKLATSTLLLSQRPPDVATSFDLAWLLIQLSMCWSHKLRAFRISGKKLRSNIVAAVAVAVEASVAKLFNHRQTIFKLLAFPKTQSDYRITCSRPRDLIGS